MNFEDNLHSGPYGNTVISTIGSHCLLKLTHTTYALANKEEAIEYKTTIWMNGNSSLHISDMFVYKISFYGVAKTEGRRCSGYVIMTSPITQIEFIKFGWKYLEYTAEMFIRDAQYSI